MNVIKRLYIKYLIKKNFTIEFVNTGIVENFVVKWDKFKQCFFVEYDLKPPPRPSEIVKMVEAEEAEEVEAEEVESEI